MITIYKLRSSYCSNVVPRWNLNFCTSVRLLTGEFLPRDAMHSVDYAVVRYPSVCLSVCHTLIFCRKAKHFIEHFLPSGSHIILVFFPYKTVWQRSDWDPLTGASIALRGMKKIAIFGQYLVLSGKWYKTAIVTTEGNRKPTQAFEWYHFYFSMTFSDL